MNPPEVDALSVDQKLRHFWHPTRRRPAAVPFGTREREPLKKQQLARFEAERGVRLPAALVALLRERDGGYCRWTHHPGINGTFERVLGVSEPMKTDWSEELEYMREESLVHPAGLKSMVGFGGGGHYFICLDYGRGGAEPAVTFVDLELWDPVVTLAESFRGFVDGLRYDSPSHEWALPVMGAREEASETVAAALGTAFAPSELSPWSCPDDDPGFEATYEEHRLSLRPNRQRDGTLLLPWRAASDWVLFANWTRHGTQPAVAAERLHARLKRAGLSPTLVAAASPS